MITQWHISIGVFVIIAIASVFLIGCKHTFEEQGMTPLPGSHSAPLPALPNPFLTLEPETGSVPAELKDEDYHRVVGEYAYVDLEAVLRLVGRIRGAEREVIRVCFFEHIAAAVSVGHDFAGTVYLCSRDTNKVWQIVGHKTYVY